MSLSVSRLPVCYLKASESRHFTFTSAIMLRVRWSDAVCRQSYVCELVTQAYDTRAWCVRDINYQRGVSYTCEFALVLRCQGDHRLGLQSLSRTVRGCIRLIRVLSKHSCTHPCLHHHHHQSLNREGRWGTTDDFATSFSHFPCSPLPSRTRRTPNLSIP